MEIIGVALGVTKVQVGRVRNHSLEKIASADINAGESVAEILKTVFKLIDIQFNSSVGSIGIGVPGPVSLQSGIVYKMQNFPLWQDVHLKDIVEKQYHVPVYLNNDANCFALGEKYYGKLKPYLNGAGLVIGTGLGAGLILDDRLYSGVSCGAGEFGTIPYNHRTFEDFCSGKFFMEAYGIKGEIVNQRALDGDTHALKIFSEFGVHLGNVIKVILGAVDPEMIVLGGSVSRSFPFFKNDMWASIRMYDFYPPVERLKVEVSQVQHVGVLGAAALCIDPALSRRPEAVLVPEPRLRDRPE